MRTLNTNEELPEYFYIFQSRYSDSLINRCENNNVSLRGGTLMSSGFTNAFHPDYREKYLSGDIEYTPFIPNKTTTIGSLSPFLSRVVKRYSVEYDLDVQRKFFYPSFPSRFSCIFAFGSYEDCKKMDGKNGWNIENVRKYRLCSGDIGDDWLKVVKANFKMIGMLEHYPIEIMGPDVKKFIYDHYWLGKGEISLSEVPLTDEISIPAAKCGVIYEYLIEGLLEEVK